jgi:hypothetical protein
MPFLRLVLLMLLALAATQARAQTPIRHCVGADGSPVFTDQPCASVQATPAPAASVAGRPAPPLHPPALTCAANLDQLRQAAVDAFASADANQLAGLMLWSGYREHTAVADIRALAALMRRPLLGIEVPAGDGDATQLVVRTVDADGGGGTDETRFPIERHSGCLWLRQP